MSASENKPFDLLIRNGRVVDGTGNPWFYGEVAIRGEKIAQVAPRGQIDPTSAKEVVDANGQMICPGFIDIQSHTLTEFFSNGKTLAKVSQGVTTEIMGEARTPSPFGGRIEKPFAACDLKEWDARARTWSRFRPWLEALVERGVSVNIGSFVGGSTIREYACGWEMRKPSAGEVETMCRVMDECMRDGAMGIAPALIYPPSCYACTEELIEIAKVVGHHGGVYITHIRSEAAQLLEALDEAIEIGRKGKCAVEIYHLKASGEHNWPLMPKAIERINAARAEGIDITADMYPYVASGTGLTTLIPNWASEDNKLMANLRDRATRAKIKSEMTKPSEFGAKTVDHVMPVGLKKPENQQYLGKRLDEIARMRNQEWPDTAIDLLLSEDQRIFTVYFSMSEENLKLQMQQPWLKFSTDASGGSIGTPRPGHPRGFGTYPRVLGKYVRDEQVLPLEDAIRKMTSSVAIRLGIDNRGLLRPGQYADVVVFDPDTIIDRATFLASNVLSTGVRDVWVNGTKVFSKGEHTNAMPGKIVDGPGRK
jgi:N-acyl-D-amino-acid deacylase